MNKDRFKTLLIWALIASHIILLLLWYRMHRHGIDHDRPRNIIIHRLALDDSQIRQYDQLIAEHRKQIHQHDQLIRLLKQQLYSHLHQAADSLAADSLSMLIGSVQTRIEQTHYRHFSDIRRLCRTDQLPAYQALTHEISDIFQPPHPTPSQR